MRLRQNIMLFLTAILVLGGINTALAKNARANAEIIPPFNPHYIISDAELTDYQTMSLDAVRRFLQSREGILKNYRTRDFDGAVRDAAEIIWRAGQNYGINPRFLITLLQREQSLIDNPNPNNHNLNWAMGYGLCDSCDSNDPGLQKFKGFARQVNMASWRQRYYLTYPNNFAIKINQPYLIDDVAVVPQTQATANLYIYTPHLKGNENFWIIWHRYFSREYPDGTLLQREDGDDVWLLQDGRLRLFLSKATLLSDYDPNKIIKVPASEISRYPMGVPIKFPPYSLLRAPNGTVYLLGEKNKRGIASPEALRQLGYNPEEIIDVEWSDLEPYPEGKPLRATDSNPLGELLQNNKTGAVFFVLNNKRHPIVSRMVLKNKFPRYSIKPVSPTTLEAMPLVDPIKLRDGELVKTKNSPTVYIITQGKKRAINSEEVFLNFGYRWTNIITVDESTLNVHPNGAPLTN